MKRVLSIVVIMALSLGVAMAQSPKQEGSNFAKRIVEYAAQSNSDAVAAEGMSLYNYVMELSIEEHESFIEGFKSSAVQSCVEHGFRNEHADALIAFMEDVVKSVADYKRGDDDDEPMDDYDGFEF